MSTAFSVVPLTATLIFVKSPSTARKPCAPRAQSRQTSEGGFAIAPGSRVNMKRVCVRIQLTCFEDSWIGFDVNSHCPSRPGNSPHRIADS